MHPFHLRSSSPRHNQLFNNLPTLCLALFLALGIALLASPSHAQRAIPMPALPVSAVVPGEVLVGVRADQDNAQEAARLSTIGGAVVGRQASLHAYHMRLQPGLSIASAIARLQQFGEVAYAEPNHIYHIASTPNDTFYSTQQYGPAKVQADLAWDIWNPSAPVILAIVDTGIDGTHPDLTNKMYRDSNGNILGYNSVTGVTGAASDDFGHGTHCAGIAAAQINNGAGIAGIAGWNGSASVSDTTYTKLMPVKVLDSSGNGTDATVADGITWAANNGAKVISMSLGGSDSSTTLNSAVQYAWGKGCVIVAAAGNSGANVLSYPGAYSNVISVAATDSTDTLANYSNYGSWVLVAAPGSAIYSTLPTYSTSGGYGTNYGLLSGTSMATPHVAGEAALIMAQNPNLTNSQVFSLITTNVDPYTPFYTNGNISGGRINVYRALLAAGGAARVPAAPTNLVATGGNALANLFWNAPPGTVTYNIKRSLVNGGPYTNIATGVTTTSYTDTGLTNGTTYYYVVSAVTSAGEGPNSNQGVAIPSNQAYLYRINSGGGVVSPFSADNFFTGGTAYSDTQTIDTSGVANVAPAAIYQTQRYGNFSYAIPGLTPAASYTVRLHFAETFYTTTGQRLFNVTINGTTVLSSFDVVSAAGAANRAVVEQFTGVANSSGNITIAFSTVTSQPFVNGIEILNGTNNSPAAGPTNLQATAGNAQVSLTWTGVTGATSYNVYRTLTSGSGYAMIGSSTTTGYVDTGLTNGTTYYYVVTAVTSAGESAQSSEVSATPADQGALYRIHAGPGTIGAFNPDNYFTGGSLYSVTQAIDTSAANAAPMAVYQTQRYGNFSYVMPNLTPGTNYTVRLHFAESYFTTAGQRFFNVAINGATVLSNFDIATVAGAVNKALVEQFTTAADSKGNITITFTTGTNLPLVNAVEILSSTVTAGPNNLQAVAGNAQVTLSWGSVSGATSYNVYRTLTSGSGYAKIGSSTTTGYVDTGLTNGTTYYYVVTAVTSAGESAQSSEVSATPSSVIALYRIHAGPGTIGTFNPDNYYTGGSLYSVTQAIDTSAANAAPMAVYQTQRYGNFSYVMPNLTPGTNYTVRLHFAESYFTTAGQRFFNVAINGTTVLSHFDIATVAGAVNKALVEQFTAAADSSGNITITFTTGTNQPLVNAVEILSSTVTAGPNNLQAVAGNAQVTLSWGSVSGATSYNVYRTLTSGSGYAKIGSSTTTGYVDTGLTNGTTYYYVVTAVTGSGESSQSSEVSATPSSVIALYRIHAGPGTIGAFNPDNYFTGGSLYTATQSIDTSAANAAPMAVYQTQRYGNFSYIMPNLTPGTNYTVRLHFAESYFTTAGQRFFNVAINGAAVLSNFDIATVAGGVNKALVEQFTATADSSGNITITFSTGTNLPLVNGVEILH